MTAGPTHPVARRQGGSRAGSSLRPRGGEGTRQGQGQKPVRQGRALLLLPLWWEGQASRSIREAAREVEAAQRLGNPPPLPLPASCGRRPKDNKHPPSRSSGCKASRSAQGPNSSSHLVPPSFWETFEQKQRPSHTPCLSSASCRIQFCSYK